MAREFAFRFRGAGNLLGPIRHRAIPDEGVTPHGHLVDLGECQDLVGEVEIELVARRPEIIPEQAVFRRQLLAVGFESDSVLGFLQERRGIDAGTVGDALPSARRCGSGCRRQARGKSSARQRRHKARASEN